MASIRNAPSEKTAVVVHGDKEKAYTYSSFYRMMQEFTSLISDVDSPSYQRIALVVDRSAQALAAMCSCIANRISFTMIPHKTARGIIDSQMSALMPDALFAVTESSTRMSKLSDGGQGSTGKKAEGVAYIVFTSGSSGVPKGVMISERSLSCALESIAKGTKLELCSEFLASTSFSFDIAYFELLYPLLTEKCVHLASEKYASNPHLLANLIQRGVVDAVQMTPSHLRLLGKFKKNYEFLDGVKVLLVGGELFPSELVPVLVNTVKSVYNMYGPTEATMWCSAKRIVEHDEVTIGKPLEGVWFGIYDECGQPVRDGAAGQLMISGTQLFSGYLGDNAEWDDKSFYPTGDIAFKDRKGEYHLVGRLDNQVKINGHRIELESIETEVMKASDCVAAVARCTECGIVCYYEGDRGINVISVKRKLADRLPVCAIPRLFIKIDSLPLTESGKIDRGAILWP